MLEERLIDIESKITFQEDLLQDLNRTVYEQQKKIERLEALCESLIGHVRELSEAAGERAGSNERPPHY
jgi:SlyX protein